MAEQRRSRPWRRPAASAPCSSPRRRSRRTARRQEKTLGRGSRKPPCPMGSQEAAAPWTAPAPSPGPRGPESAAEQERPAPHWPALVVAGSRWGTALAAPTPGPCPSSGARPASAPGCWRCAGRRGSEGGAAVGEAEPSEERRGRGGEGERERWEQCAWAVTGEWGRVMRRRLRLPRCPRRATASHAWPRAARLARNCRFGSFRRARLRAALRSVRASNRMQPRQPNRPRTSRAGLVGLHAGNQPRPMCTWFNAMWVCTISFLKHVFLVFYNIT